MPGGVLKNTGVSQHGAAFPFGLHYWRQQLTPLQAGQWQITRSNLASGKQYCDTRQSTLALYLLLAFYWA
jgi:hypothetical protein